MTMPNIPAADPPMIFRFVGDSLSNLTEGYVGQAAGQLIGMLAPIAITGVTIFLLVYAYMMMMGKISSPITDLTMKLFKMGLVLSIALSASTYSTIVVGTIDGIESGLVQALSPSGLPSSSTYEALDNGLGKGNALVLYCWAEASTKSLLTNPGHFVGWYGAGSIIATGLVVFFIVGGSMVVIAKFMLAVMLAIGPLFVMLLAWAPTAQFFDRWLSQTLTSVFTIVILTVVFGMGLQIFNNLIVATSSGGEWESPMFMAMQITFITIILGILCGYAGVKASALGGGAALASVSLGQAVGLLRSPAQAATATGRMLNPVSNRLDPKTGLQTTSSALEHLAMGRSLVSPNPAYRRAVMDQFRESIGAKNTVSGR